MGKMLITHKKSLKIFTAFVPRIRKSQKGGGVLCILWTIPGCCGKGEGGREGGRQISTMKRQQM